MAIKKLFLDVETTGTDHTKHSIWQLAWLYEVDGILIDQGNIKCRPVRGSVATPEALKVGNITYDYLKALPESEKGFRQFVSFLDNSVAKFDKKDKMFFIAYNAQFDENFVRRWFDYHNEGKHKSKQFWFGSYFWSGRICVLSLAADKLANRRAEMENFQLGTVAEELGVKLKGNLHDALADTTLMYDIYNEIRTK